MRFCFAFMFFLHNITIWFIKIKRNAMNNEKIENNTALYKVLVHASVCIFILMLPVLLSLHNNFRFVFILEHSWIPIFLCFIVFYVNYIVLVDRVFLTKKKWLFFVSNAILLLVLAYLDQTLKPYLFHHFMWQIPYRPMFFVYGIMMDMLTMVLPLVLAIAFKIYERWQAMERKQQESANAQLQTELKHLEYQIQPHFFFNSLNNIYSLVDISPERAKETIHNLSKLMRYLLYETNSALVPLDGEIAFMSKYIELMKLRTSANTKVEYTFPENTFGIMVAPLLFISLIENSFKHGIKPIGTSELKFEMKIDGTKVIFTTENPYFEKTGPDLSGGSSIGLENIRKRLELLYNGKSEFITSVENEKYYAYLSIDTI